MKDTLNMTEHDALEIIEAEFAKSKDSLRTIIKAARTLRDINAEAGRGRGANAAYTFSEKVRGILADTGVVHGEATDTLWELWPEHAAEFAVKSGHR